MPNLSEAGIEQIPKASHPHVWILTFFLSLFIYLLAWRSYNYSPNFALLLFDRVLYAFSACFFPLIIGFFLAAIFRISITRKSMLRQSLLESMDMDELQGGPWSVSDHLGNQIKSFRAPLRYEPPFIPQPPDLYSLHNPEVIEFIKNHSDALKKSTPYELQALSFCAFQNTPASITDSHGGVSLFSHSSKVWLAAAESFGYGSDPALLAVSHDLGKVWSYSNSGDRWTLVTSSHEHLSVIAATHLSTLLDLGEAVRRRLINHLIAYSLRKTQKTTDPEAIFSIRSVVRADSSVSSAESSAQKQQNSVHPGQPNDSVVSHIPPTDPVILENRQALADAGLLDTDNEAEVIPFPSSEAIAISASDPLIDVEIGDYQALSNQIASAITCLNINGMKRKAGATEGLYCQDTGFFVRVSDIVRQLKSDGVALEMSKEESMLPPWQTSAGTLILTVMLRTGWIVQSPGRFSSDQGDRGVFNLKSGSKRHNGMVSINTDMLSQDYLSTVNEWCFDIDAVR